MNTKDKGRVLITGATGYVGGNLLKELEKTNHPLRCLTRHPEYLLHRKASATEFVKGDVFDLKSLHATMSGVHTAYYLIHSLGGKGSYEQLDRKAAHNFGKTALERGVKKIIYLGGLGREPGLSRHLSSRQEVGAILRESGVPTIEFRASIIIGSGSLSFEMVRSLVQKLPIMTTPRWVRMLAQPIAIEDVLGYLLAALDLDLKESVVYEIGGSDKVSYEGIMREYAQIRGVKRLIIPVPVLSPWLSSLWLALVTPLFFKVGRELIEGIRNQTIVRDEKASETFAIRPLSTRMAIEQALENENREFAATRWSNALPSSTLKRGRIGVKFGTRIVYSSEIRADCPPAEIFRHIQCIKDRYSSKSYSWLWNLSGFIDRLRQFFILKKNQRDSRYLYPVSRGSCCEEAVELNRLVRLCAGIKKLGRSWLQFEIKSDNSASTLRQTVIFDPVGLEGLLYWHLFYPFHIVIFNKILKSAVHSSKG